MESSQPTGTKTMLFFLIKIVFYVYLLVKAFQLRHWWKNTPPEQRAIDVANHWLRNKEDYLHCAFWAGVLVCLLAFIAVMSK